MLLENDGIILLADPHMRGKCVRLRNLFDRFQIAALIFHREKLPCAVRAHSFNDVACSVKAGPVSTWRRKCGGTPSSNTSRMTVPASV